MYNPNKYINEELEKTIIGSILINSDNIFKVIDLLKPEHFQIFEYKILFKEIVELVKNNIQIDIISVYTQVKNKGLVEKDSILSAYFITQLTKTIGIVKEERLVNFSYKLIELYLVNKIYDDCRKIVSGIENNHFSDIDEIVNSYQSNINEIETAQFGKEPIHISTVLTENFEKIQKISENPSLIIGVPTGIKTLDKHTNGWQNSDLIIIAARPSMGKTSLMLNMAKNSAMYNQPCLIFSLEMSANQLTNRLEVDQIDTELDIKKLKSGKLDSNDWNDYQNAINYLKEMQIYFDDTASISILDLKSKIRKMIIKKGIKLVMIDYLQLMKYDNSTYKNNREGEISAITRSLKGIAKEFNIPIIAFSQLNRQLEQRSNKKPLLSDLRESGAIEQDADIVLFIHRPEKYQIEQLEDKNGNLISSKGMAELILEKHRNGSTGTILCNFNETKMRFTDYEICEVENFINEFENNTHKDNTNFTF